MARRILLLILIGLTAVAAGCAAINEVNKKIDEQIDRMAFPDRY